MKKITADLSLVNTNRIKVSEEEVKDINRENLFIAIIEPKLNSMESAEIFSDVVADIFTDLMESFASVKTPKAPKEPKIIEFDKIKKARKKTSKETSKQKEPKIIEFDRIKQIRETIKSDEFKAAFQSEASKMMDELNFDSERQTSISNGIAFLAVVNGKLYDFIDGSYLNLEDWYINYAMPVSEVFEEEECQLVFVGNLETVGITANEEKSEEFLQIHSQEIDKEAYNKILSAYNKHTKKLK